MALGNPYLPDMPIHKGPYSHLIAERGGSVWANDFRLGLLSSAYLPSTNTASTSTLYFNPKHIPIDQTAPGYITVISPNGQPITLLAPATSLNVTGVVSGKNYDVFALYASSRSVALELGTAWTTDSARATPLGVYQGKLVKSTNPTRLYVGTIRASATNLVADTGGGADTIAQRFVYNYYNQIMMPSNPYYNNYITINGDGAWHGVTAARAEWVVGMQTSGICEARSQYIWNNSAASSTYLGFGYNGSNPAIDQQHLVQNIPNAAAPAAGGFGGRVLDPGYFYADPYYQSTNATTGFVGYPGLSAAVWM